MRCRCWIGVAPMWHHGRTDPATNWNPRIEVMEPAGVELCASMRFHRRFRQLGHFVVSLLVFDGRLDQGIKVFTCLPCPWICFRARCIPP